MNDPEAVGISILSTVITTLTIAALKKLGAKWQQLKEAWAMTQQEL
jgi:hypothetical protein